MDQNRTQHATGRILSIALLITMLMASATHFCRHLNLSGDEVFFYFMGMKDNWSDYRPYYENVRSQLSDEDREPHLQMSTVQLANLQTSQFYLGIEPAYFAEYKLPRLLWGIVSGMVAPTRILKRSDQTLADGLGDSVFFMLGMGYLIVCPLVVAVTYRLSNFAKTVLLVFMVMTFLKESFLRIDAAAFFQAFPAPVALFLSTMISENKDMMTFGFSGRSLFLVFAAAYLACRWEALYRTRAASLGSYPFLPILTLVHATYGVIVAAIILGTDLITGRERLRDRVVSLSYAASFGFALDGGTAAQPSVFAGLSFLTISFLLAGLLFSRVNPSEVEPAKGLRNWRIEVLMIGIFALGFLFLVQPIATFAGSSANRWLILLGQRLGNIFGVMFLFAASWFAVEMSSRRLKSGLGRMVLAATAVPIVVAAIVATTDLTFDVAQVRYRLRSQSADYLSSIKQPISFTANNELHEIWYSIIKSSIHNKDYTVKLSSTTHPSE